MSLACKCAIALAALVSTALVSIPAAAGRGPNRPIQIGAIILQSGGALALFLGQQSK